MKNLDIPDHVAIKHEDECLKILINPEIEPRI